MARVREKLSRAPVTEAVLDFRTRLPEGTSLATLRKAIGGLVREYPHVEDAWLLSGSVEFSPGLESPISSGSKTPNGYFARTADGKQIAQFRLDGFTFSRLAPYTSWQEVSREAFRLWETYREAAKPAALYRIAVRYINNIPLPDDSVEMNDLLTSAPQVPEELPQLLGGFLTKVVVPLPVRNAHVSIVQAYQAPPAAAPSSILLDIDVFRTDEVDLAVGNLKPMFEQLRTYKNLAFFGGLTEETVRRLE